MDVTVFVYRCSVRMSQGRTCNSCTGTRYSIILSGGDAVYDLREVCIIEAGGNEASGRGD
eukprot:CAMPEP_0198696040 /NCGR_PEP_ID=MMETSP1468-20131203/298666_1 /TAXON_ID=1461545 /ORGANISM="Mantoniella sp, Strain CCMP1436" /LENGTH=59 /DNA_ID=CAMNT_0044452063 /DNA_START=443 /DNA_END=622 /DNA_ORIENTATION=+